MTTLVAGVVALLALAFPGVREQVALSATHQEQEFVALSFARGADGTVVPCAATRRQVRVEFVVTSALADARTLAYEVSVGRHRVADAVPVEPGESVTVARDLPIPGARRYDVSVRLPGEDRRILAHCGGAS